MDSNDIFSSFIPLLIKIHFGVIIYVIFDLSNGMKSIEEAQGIAEGLRKYIEEGMNKNAIRIHTSS